MSLKLTGQIKQSGQITENDGTISFPLPTLPLTYEWDSIVTNDWEELPGNGNMTTSGGDLVMSASDFSGTPAQPTIKYRHTLQGDFDFYSFIDTNTGFDAPTNAIKSFLRMETGGYVYFWGAIDASFQNIGEQAWTNNPAVSGTFNTIVGNGDPTCRYRMQRVGSTLTLYRIQSDSSSTWQQRGTPVNIGTGDVTIALELNGGGVGASHPDGLQTTRHRFTYVNASSVI